MAPKSTSAGGASFQITVSKPAQRYLKLLAQVSALGSSYNEVAANIVTREVERMRLSGDYPKEVPQADDEK